MTVDEIRAELAKHIAAGTLTKDDAGWIIHEVQEIAGWFPIEELSISDVAEHAATYWPDAKADDLDKLSAMACRRIWNKWESNTDTLAVAEDWAIDLIGEYAEEQGINLGMPAREANDDT